MAIVLPGIVAEFFMFGYLGYLWTHSLFLTAGVAFAVWVSAIAFTVHNVSEFTIFFIAPASLWLGTLLGWLVGNAAVLAPLVPRLAYYMVMMVITGTGKSDEDSDLDGTYYIETYGRQQAVLVGSILVIVGIVMLLGTYEGHLRFATSLILGITFGVLGLALLIYGLWALFASEYRADRADARYLVYLLAFVVLLPLAYNLTAHFFPPFEIFVFWLVLAAVTAIVVMLELRHVAVRAASPAIPLENDVRYLRNERYPARIILRWVVVTALPLFIVQTTGWVVEEFVEETNIDKVYIAVAVAVLVIALVAVCCGGLSRPGNGTSGQIRTVQRQMDEESGGSPRPSPSSSSNNNSSNASNVTNDGQPEQRLRSKTRRKGVDVRPKTNN